MVDTFQIHTLAIENHFLPIFELNLNPSNMKQKTYTLTKKITAYSSLAVSLLTISNLANGQIVYTDLNPDVAGSGNGAHYDLDLNNDGTVDFKINLSTNGGQGIKLVADPLGNNAIAGTYNTTGAPYQYPSALDLNDIIGETLIWNEGAAQTMCSDGYGFQNPYGHWFGATDNYMGLLLKIGSGTHYGWMRMDVANDGKSFTVKDYAFESNSGTSIAAGAGNVGITPVNANGYQIFAADQQIHVKAKPGAGTITISNLVGQIIRQAEISASSMTVDMTDHAGSVVVVTIHQNGEVFTQKVML